MFRILVLSSLFLVGSAFYSCSEGYKLFIREPTIDNEMTSGICLKVVTAPKGSQNLTPDEICEKEGYGTRFSNAETYAEAEWLWNQTHVGDGILINGMLTVLCNTTNVNGKVEGLCDYDDDNRKKVITTRDMNTDPALMKFELIFHPELELYSVPKRPTSSKLYEAYCPLFLKKQVWYDIPRWVDVKNCGTKKEIQENFGKDGRMSVTRQIGNLRASARRNLALETYFKLIRFFKIADKMCSIEGSQTNLKCLLVSAHLLSQFFLETLSKSPQFLESFEDLHISHRLTQKDIEICATWRVISDVARTRYQHHVEVKKTCQEQKHFRESFLKTQTDFDIDFEDHEADQETKLLSIEDAVLIIQKLERKYQAISRRNYVRFVRERAAELHGQKAEIDATQAAIRIQARTRGYFARKMVREMRQTELNILKMTPESYIRIRMSDRQKTQNHEKIHQVDDLPLQIDPILENLKSNFFLALGDLPYPLKLQKSIIPPDTVFRDACFRGIVSPLATVTLEELISQKEQCHVEQRQFKFDLKTFLSLTVCLPLSLATWKSQKSRPLWLLISGPQDSGKTAWTRGIARNCHVTHVHVSKNVVNMGKRRIYTVIKKLARQERRLLISIDRIDVLKKDPKHKGMTHRQMLLRTFLTDISATSATVIGMTKIGIDDLESSILDLFPLKVSLSNPTAATRYDLAVDCLSRNMEQDRLPKIPNRIFDLEKQTSGFGHGKAAKFVTNRWSAANNKTNLS